MRIVFRTTLVHLFCLSAVLSLMASAPETAPKRNQGGSSVVILGPIEMQAVLVEGGTFNMGDMWSVGGDNEKPVHEVKLSDFYISISEVTIGEYKEFCKRTHRKMPLQDDGSQDNFPVAYVTWYEAKNFCDWVGGQLPTEAQWEYSARCKGKPMIYPSGEHIDHSLANYSGKERKDRWERTSPVKKFKPNVLGIYDLAGNLYEWCFDYYKSDYYAKSFKVDPTGPSSGLYKVLRGGSWYHHENELRTSHRFRYLAVARVSYVGFRVAWNPDKTQIK